MNKHKAIEEWIGLILKQSNALTESIENLKQWFKIEKENLEMEIAHLHLLKNEEATRNEYTPDNKINENLPF